MRKQNYAYCESCVNKVITREAGMVCGLSNQKPNFESQCKDFSFDREKFIYAYNSLNRNALILDVKKRVLHLFVDTIFWTTLMYYVFGFLLVITENFWIVLLGTLSISFLLYFVLFEYYIGKTVGKIITKTIVLDAGTLEKPKLWQILVRASMRLPVINMLDALVAFSGEPLHDALSKTRVYYSNQETLEKARILRDLKNANPEATDFMK